MSRSTPPLNNPWLIAIVGGAIATILGSLALNAMIEPLLLGVVFLGFFIWYWIILDYRDSAEGSKARVAYNRLRSNLRGVNKSKDTPFGEWYRNEITNKLNGVARWFGDADHLNSNRLCGQLGLVQARTLWTSESYDRCMFLALLYPLVCLFIFWVINGTTGPAEQALGLTATQSMLGRIGTAGGLLVAMFLVRKASRSEGIRSFLYLLGAVAIAIAIAIAIAVAGAGAGAFAFAVAVVVVVVVVVAGAFAGAGAGAFAVSATLTLTFTFAFTFTFTFTDASAVASAVASVVAGAVAGAVASFVYWVMLKTRRNGQNVAYGIYTLLIIMGLAISPAIISRSEVWEVTGPLLLFFGVLVFVNAPLDWLTLGVTRALLWRGVDRRGLSPFVLSLVDIGVALFLLAILSVLMILAIQLFNAAAVLGVRESIDPAIIDAAVFLNPADLVAGMANPATQRNPEYWWIYATLFSTLLPSWLHLLVASGCFVRGSTRLNQLIGQELPLGKKGESLLPHIQTKLAVLLALQRSFGLALATTVFFGGLWLVFFVLFPHVIPRLLDIATPLAQSDWAARFVATITEMMGALDEWMYKKIFYHL